MKLFNRQKKESGKSSSRKQATGEKVDRDWGIMLFGFAVAVLIVVMLDGYFFVRISRGDFFPPEGTFSPGAEALNRKTLLDTAGFFEARQKEYDAFRSTSTPQIDPSM